MTVAPPLGRNDSPATATRVGNGMFQASISPFTDTPNVSTPDTDYYRILVAAGHAVHVETFAKQYFTVILSIRFWSSPIPTEFN